MMQRDNMEKSRVLVVDDDVYLLAAIRQTLTMRGYDVATSDKPLVALSMIPDGDYLAVMADIKMPRMDGLELLERIKEIDRDLPVIIITGHGDVAMAVRAMKNGAYDFLEKPVDEDVMLASLSRAVERQRLVLENQALCRRLELDRAGRIRFHGLLGQHPSMQILFSRIELVAEENDTVLISGETGTGKELVARAIHDLSSRRDQPFVAINMGAIPGEMLEAELFGYARGAFTGAVQNKAGKFEYAGQGTLFLDEICSMPAGLQAKLLRVLEEKTVTPLGSNNAVPVCARIVTATNRNLELEIRKGSFRQDLFFRLNVLPLEIPPLRERRSDIVLLADYFREEYCRDRKQEVLPFDQQTIDDMSRRDWLGNVRELRNYVRRLCVYSAVVEQSAEKKGERAASQVNAEGVKLKDLVERVEEQHILRTMTRYRGSVVQVHKALGISRKCLYDKLTKYGVDIASFRHGKGEQDIA